MNGRGCNAIYSVKRVYSYLAQNTAQNVVHTSAVRQFRSRAVSSPPLPRNIGFWTVRLWNSFPSMFWGRGREVEGACVGELHRPNPPLPRIRIEVVRLGNTPPSEFSGRGDLENVTHKRRSEGNSTNPLLALCT